MARYRKCIFCNKTDSPPDKEDVLAKWIAREWPHGAKSLFKVEAGHDLSKPDRVFHTRGHLGMIAQGPCRRCNNGWMSDLETAVKPIFQPLFRGIRSTITTSQQLTIAQWTIKTAINYEFARNRSPRFFKPTNRREFFRSRLIPDDTFIFLGHCILGDKSIRAFDGSAPLTIWPNTPKAAPMDGYVMTLAIGQLALQVFSLRRPENYLDNISIKIPGAWDPAQIDVWPIRRNRVWPPQQTFDDTGLEEFVNRWRTVIP